MLREDTWDLKNHSWQFPLDGLISLIHSEKVSICPWVLLGIQHDTYGIGLPLPPLQDGSVAWCYAGQVPGTNEIG